MYCGSVLPIQIGFILTTYRLPKTPQCRQIYVSKDLYHLQYQTVLFRNNYCYAVCNVIQESNTDEIDEFKRHQQLRNNYNFKWTSAVADSETNDKRSADKKTQT